MTDGLPAVPPTAARVAAAVAASGRSRDELVRPGRDGGEGLSDEARAVFPEGARSDALVPKLQAPESLKLLVAGRPAGRLTAIVPGSPFRNAPSRLVFRKIART
ncbi:MAG TPA: hypothetical protein VEP12_06395 [Candidatus Acidoferrum sp.]|nr:hypothetical protein [Candidatus Acidoferrum sp.]